MVRPEDGVADVGLIGFGVICHPAFLEHDCTGYRGPRLSAALWRENEACVSRITDELFWSSSSNDVEEELPVDIEDGTVYVTVPNKRHLDLGRELALRLVEEHTPESCEFVHGVFRSGGAYRRFKTLLERKNQPEIWYEFEKTAVEEALREWSAENLQLKS